MIIQKIRYIVHPDDEINLALTAGEQFSEIKVLFDVTGEKPFITQVEDRLTIADEAVRVTQEFVKHPVRDEDI